MPAKFSAEGDPDCKHRSHYECMSCRKMVCTRCGAVLAAATYEWKTGGYWCPDCLEKNPRIGRRASRADLVAQIAADVTRMTLEWRDAEDGDRADRLTWLRLLDERRIRATRHGIGDDAYRSDLVRIAALAIAAIETLDRKRETPSP